MRAEPRISAIIPVYNRAHYLAEAIHSLLVQDPAPFEIIVVDDGSSDGSGDVARSFGPPVRCITQVNAGIAAAWNRGIAEAGGEFLAFLDSDDIMPPGALARQTRILRDHPEVDCCSGVMVNFRDHLQADGTSRREYSHPLNMSTMTTTLFRASLFPRVGPLDSFFRITCDLDFLKRAQEAGAVFHFHDGVVLQARIHAGNTTGDRAALRHEIFQVIRRAKTREAGSRENETRRRIPTAEAE